MIFGTSKEQIETQTVLMCSWGGGKKTWIFTQIWISSKWNRCNFTSAADQASSSSLAGSNGAASAVPFAAARGVTDGDGNIGNGDSLNVGVTVGEFPQFSAQPVQFPVSVPFYDALGWGSCSPLPSVGCLPFISSSILRSELDGQEERGDETQHSFWSLHCARSLIHSAMARHAGSQPWGHGLLFSPFLGTTAFAAWGLHNHMMPSVIWKCLALSSMFFLHEFSAFPCLGSGNLTRLYEKSQITMHHHKFSKNHPEVRNLPWKTLRNDQRVTIVYPTKTQ